MRPIGIIMISIATALAAACLILFYGGQHRSHRLPGATKPHVKRQLRVVESEVRRYAEKHGRVPEQLATPPVDPWGRELLYKRIGSQGYEVFSVGPDGIEGTADDIR